MEWLLLLACVLALRVPAVSQRGLYTGVVFQEQISVFLHSVDLGRSLRELAGVLESRRYPFQRSYDLGCRDRMDPGRYGEVCRLVRTGGCQVSQLLASPDCLAVLPAETWAGGLPGYPNALASVLLATVPIEAKLPDGVCAGEALKVLDLPLSRVASCLWIAKISGVPDWFSRRQRDRIWDRLHPQCFHDAFQRSDYRYVHGLNHFILERPLDPPRGAVAEGYYARLALRLSLYYLVVQHADSKSRFKFDGVFCREIKRRMEGVQRKLEPLAREHGWAPRLAQVMARVLEQNREPLPPPEELLGSCLRAAEDPGADPELAGHWRLLVVQLYGWVTRELSGELREALGRCLESRPVWPLDAVLAYRLASRYRGGTGTPPAGLVRLVRWRGAGPVQDRLLAKAAGRLQAWEEDYRPALGRFLEAVVLAVPFERRLRFVREQYGVLWLGREPPGGAAWPSASRPGVLAALARRPASLLPGGRVGAMVGRMFAELLGEGVLRLRSPWHRVQLSDRRRMEAVGAMLGLAVLFQVRLPGRLKPGQLRVLLGYDRRRTVAASEPARPCYVVAGFGERWEFAAGALLDHSRESAHQVLNAAVNQAIGGVYGLVPGVRLLRFAEVLAMIQPP